VFGSFVVPLVERVFVPLILCVGDRPFVSDGAANHAGSFIRQARLTHSTTHLCTMASNQLTCPYPTFIQIGHVLSFFRPFNRPLQRWVSVARLRLDRIAIQFLIKTAGTIWLPI